MSGSFDRKSSGADRRQARIQKEQKEKKKTRIIAVSVTVVLALLFLGAAFLNSKYIRRNMTAATIGDVNFTAVEFDYFFKIFHQEYENWVNEQFGEMAGMSGMLPQSGVSLSKQIYDEETGETWADYITEYAVSQLSVMVQYYSAAKAAGYVLPDEMRAELDDQIAYVKMYAEIYGFPSFDYFLQQNYGINMNEKCYRKISEFIFTANAFSENVRDLPEYSQAALESHYNENRDTLDIFTFRYILVGSETVLKDDFDTDEEFDAAKEAALEEARQQAALIAAGIETEDDFINAAREYDEESFDDPDSTLRSYPGSWLGSYYGPWMREGERVYGDLTNEDMTSGTYIVFFISRDDNSYRMTEMRQILILREDVHDEYFGDEEHDHDHEDDAGFLEALEWADAEARGRADVVMNLFREGGATESRLLELMADYSDDTTEGGFYDNIHKDPTTQGKMVQEIEDWLFDESRQYGDYEMIETEAYGYHLVFFMGHGDRYCDVLADNEMRTNDYNAWQEGLAPVEFSKRWAFFFTEQ